MVGKTKIDWISSSPPPASDGRKRRGDKSRAAVLARAIQVASSEGLEGLTIGRLAADVGISKGNITVLFGDKIALQIATLHAAVGVFVEHVVAPARVHAAPLAKLRALTDGWFTYVETRILPGGCMLHGASSEYRARPGVIQDHVKASWSAWRDLLAQTVREAQSANEIQAEADADQLVFEILAFHSAANVASLLGDTAAFHRARRATSDRISRLTIADLPTQGPRPVTALARRGKRRA
jgi:AcrR family transcriptional regulator